ncbi:MAG TPA: cation:proton antiporter [Pirellulales bacterium]|nr:cation:proton antiporter [Pirellulales bacterium]
MEWIATARKRRVLAAYVLMVAAAVGLFLLIVHFGASLTPALPAKTAASGNAADAPLASPLFHVLLSLAAVIVTARLLNVVLGRFQQPPVIGEMLAGVMLGPSLLGWIAPAVSDWLLPTSVAGSLGIVANLGIILYMFLVGLELNTELLSDRAHTTVAISHASIVAPFLLGAVLALGLYPRLAEGHVSFTTFALFLGVAMSITAFPVLARILTDRQMTKTTLGVVALSCAATDDVTAWCLLAMVVGVAKGEVGEALVVIAGALAYIGFIFVAVRPATNWIVHRHDDHLTPGVTALAFVAVLLSALSTEWIGIHAIFGAFLLGVVIPHDSALARELNYKLEDPVKILLLPAFFAFTGMRTEIGLVSGLASWLICGLVILVATLGKFGGTIAAARLTGMGWRDGAALGILMNTRGLMELVVLNIGLDLGVISPTLFAMMVLMAIVTTMATTPLVARLVPATKMR